MIEKDIIIKCNEGIHMRPAGQIVKITANSKCDVKIIYKNNIVNPKSLLSLLSAGIKVEENIKLSVNGEDEDKIFNAITTILAQ